MSKPCFCPIAEDSHARPSKSPPCAYHRSSGDSPNARGCEARCLVVRLRRGPTKPQPVVDNRVSIFCTQSCRQTCRRIAVIPSHSFGAVVCAEKCSFLHSRQANTDKMSHKQAHRRVQALSCEHPGMPISSSKSINFIVAISSPRPSHAFS